MSVRMKTMTDSRAPKRDKHPARSARILTSGIAISSTLGLSAAYTLAAQAKALKSESTSAPSAAVDPALTPAGSVAQTIALAPTTPAGATPVASQSNKQATPGSAPAAQTPVSAASPQIAVPTEIQIPVATPAPAPVVTVAPSTSSSK